jgi:hypothetical protein
MGNNGPICCRVAACRESLDDGKEWSFYLINDSDLTIDLAVLNNVGYEWGDWGNNEITNVRITNLLPGAHAIIWRDDGNGVELRMELTLLLQVRGREMRLQFEFPKLYRRSNLPIIDILGKPGWQENAKGKEK